MQASDSASPSRFHRLIAVARVMSLGLAAFGSWSGVLAGWQQASLWLIAVGFVIGYRLTGQALFGPVLLYDMVRSARRPQIATLRCLYAGLLLLTLFSVYCRWFMTETGSLWTPFVAREVDRARMAEFGEAVFLSYLAVQFIAIFLLTPACTAGAIAEEKDRRGLDYLFATDLSSREIILSMYLSRLSSLVLVLLTGLPMLSLLQFFGGVDPQLVLASFAASGMTLLSVGAWSVLCSVYTRKPRFAILLAGLGPVAYLLLSWLLWSVVFPPLGFTVWRTATVGGSLLSFRRPMPISGPMVGGPDSMETLVAWMNCGNPYTVWLRIEDNMAAGAGTLTQLLPAALQDYALFHGLFALFCLTWAVLRLRPVALRQAGRGIHSRASRFEGLSGLPIRRPRVGNFPMLWKELYVEATPLRMISGFLFLALLIYVCLLPVLVVVLLLYYWELDPLAKWFQPVFREASMVLASLMLLGVAIRAAGSVSGERDRGSLDALLLAPQDSNTILFAKWLGSIFGIRYLAVWLGFLWLLGLALDAYSGDALVWMSVALLFYAAFAASLGMWFSVVCQTGQRALLWTLIVAALVFGGHWLIWMLILPLVRFVTGAGSAGVFADHLQSYGLTPPLAFQLLSSVGDKWSGKSPLRDELVSISLLTGLALYGLGAVLFWTLASKRFRKMAGRSTEAFSVLAALEIVPPNRRRSAAPLPPVALNWPEESPT